MSKWNAEHQKGIEPTFLTRREGWGSQRRYSLMRVGRENPGGDWTREWSPQPFFSPLLLRKRAHREKESDNFT